MRKSLSLVTVTVLLPLMVLAGCGGGGSITPAALPDPNTGGIVSPVTGDTTFWAVDFTTSSAYTIKAAKVATGTHCYVYLEQGKSLDQTTINMIMNEFDNNIYLSTTTAFGSEPNPGIDNDTKITILLLDIKDGFNGTTQTSYIAGYFDPYDEYNYSDSNKREMFYMDINPATPASIQFFGTLAHEFQHMIHWNVKPTDETWLNEAMSEISPVYAGYGPSYSRAFTFEQNPSDSLTDWGYALADYGVAYMWSQYFMDRFSAANPNIFWSMLHSAGTGSNSVAAAVNAIDPSLTFASTFKDWSLALYSGNAITWPGHTEWSYTSLNTWPGTYLSQGRTYTLPGLFPASKQNITALATLPQWSVNFYSYTPVSGSTGTVTWTTGSTSNAALADASPLMSQTLVSGQSYTFNTLGYLIVNNRSVADNVAAGSVVRSSLFENVTDLDGASPAPVLLSPKAMLDHANADRGVKKLIEQTGEPQSVCIHPYLREKEQALKAKGYKSYKHAEKH